MKSVSYCRISFSRVSYLFILIACISICFDHSSCWLLCFGLSLLILSVCFFLPDSFLSIHLFPFSHYTFSFSRSSKLFMSESVEISHILDAPAKVKTAIVSFDDLQKIQATYRLNGKTHFK